MRVVEHVLGVRPGEGRTAWLVSTLMFVTMSAETIGESGVNALFFEAIGADRLPLMYIAQAGVVFIAMVLLAMALRTTAPRTAYLWLPLGLAVVVAIERLLLEPAPAWLFPVLWVTVSVAILVQMVFLWGVAGLVTDARAAKRLFPLFGAGGILGAVVGGVSTQPLASAIGAENLLLVWVAGYVIAVVLVRAASPRTAIRRPTTDRAQRPTRRRSAWRELADAGRYVVRSPLLAAMAIAAVFISVLFYLLYLPYAQAAADRFPDADELAGFFGLFWAGVTGVALLVSLFATNRILGRFGVATTVVALPALYVVAFGVVAWQSTFVALVSIRFVMGVWLQAVALPAWESLTNVTPEDRRDQVRAFLNGGPTQVGTALAGVIGLVGGALTATPLAVTGVVVAAITIIVTWRIRGSYTSALVAGIRAGRPSVFGDALRGAPMVASDGVAASALVDAANDPDPQIRRLAATMLPAGHPRARASLVELLSDDDTFARITAAAALLDGPDRDRAVEVLRTALQDPDPGIRRHAVRVASERGSGDVAELVGPALTDPAPEVRAAAMLARADVADPSVLEMAAGQLRSGGIGADASVETLERLGSVAVPAVLGVLRLDPLSDAALEALSRLDASPADQDGVRAYVDQRTRDAEGYMSAVPVSGGIDAWMVLLHDALRARARAHALAAIRAAAALGGDPEAVRAAVESLDAGAVEQFATSLEVLEVELAPTLGRSTAQRLLGLWEPQVAVDTSHGPTNGWIDRFRSDGDPLIRDLAARAAGSVDVRDEEEAAVRTDVSTVLERTLALRSVPLFAGLDPADLHAVAEVAEDHAFGPGEYLAVEGDLGEDLHLIVHGAVGIEHGDPPHEFAQRTAGDVIGEMSLVSRAPRVASAVANTDVRTVRIRRAHFESMIRERPSIALSVMRVLAERARESTVAHAAADHPHA